MDFFIALKVKYCRSRMV